MTILEFYESLLTCANIYVNKEGLLEVHVEGEIIPLTIEGKSVALPTAERLADADEDVILFHPVSESLVRKESPVSRQLRRLLLARLNEVARKVIVGLTEFATHPEMHSRISPDLRDFLALVPDLKPKTLDGVEKVLQQTLTGKYETRIVSQAVRSGIKLDGELYKRVSTISFPLLASIDMEAKTFGDVKFPVKELRALETMFNYIFPDYAKRDSYSTGTHELSVPNLRAMLDGMLKMQIRLNELVSLFNLDGGDDLLFNIDYADGLDNLAKYKARIPVQPGNAGDPLEREEEPVKAPVAPTEMPGHTRSRVAPVVEVMDGVSNDVIVTPLTLKATAEELAAMTPIERLTYHQKLKHLEQALAPKEAEPIWKRQERERREAEENMLNGDIPGAVTPEEYRRMTWVDKQAYDAWYANEIAAREQVLAQQQRGGYGGYQQPRRGGYQQPQQQQQGYGYPASGGTMSRRQYEAANNGSGYGRGRY